MSADTAADEIVTGHADIVVDIDESNIASTTEVVQESTPESSQMEIAEPPEPVVKEKTWTEFWLGCVAALFSLWVFLLGLKLLGDAFKSMGGRRTGTMFSAVDDPIAGLMTGILGTVLVQSSSTSTSIIVGLVGAEQVAVQSAIFMIMGANIGTSVTNTLVSMGQAGDRIQLQRSFAGATVHDMFNFLSVAVLLPIELLFGAIFNHGPLYWITKGITDAAVGGDKKENVLKGASPVKLVTSPVAKLFISTNKDIIKALAQGAPIVRPSSEVNATVCKPLEGGSRRRLDTETRRLDETVDCSQYYCVNSKLDGYFKKISKTGYKAELTKCEGHVVGHASLCSADAKCYLDAGNYYKKYVEEKSILKGGVLKGLGDAWGGIVALIIALFLLCAGLFSLCRLLNFLFMGKAKGFIAWAIHLNDYAAMFIGIVLTIIAQSSSVTTSALTPLCGLGLIPLAKMFPLTLGANIGTTATAFIASLAAFTHGAIQVALCHLFFNLFGILIWFPIPFMREIPLGAARLLGLYSSYYRAVPMYYIFTCFVVVPGIALALSNLFKASVAAGAVAVILLGGSLTTFLVWWIAFGGCYKVLSEKDRASGEEALDRANRKLLGERVVRAEEDRD